MPTLNSEQSDELEALSAIYSTEEFILVEGGPLPQLKIILGPSTESPSSTKWVGLVLFATFPQNYPSSSAPNIELRDLKGIDEKQKAFLERMVHRVIDENSGAPCIYAIAEALREWLSENNVKPSDGSAFDEMMREKSQAASASAMSSFGGGSSSGALRRDLDPSIEKKLVTTETNAEMIARKKREGTPVTRENFLAWRSRFEKEMEAKTKTEEEKGGVTAAAMSGIAAQKAGRLTGRQLFEADSTLAQSDLGLEGGKSSTSGVGEADDIDYKNLIRRNNGGGEGGGEEDDNDEEDIDYDEEDDEDYDENDDESDEDDVDEDEEEEEEDER